MKRFRFFTVLISLLLCGFTGAALADSWKTVTRGQHGDLFGRPLQIKEVVTTKEILKNGKIYYTYKFIIQRPSKDNGWGVAKSPVGDFRLYYWAATTGTSPYFTLYNNKDVYQHTHPDPRKIVVHLLQGLHPGKHRIVVAIFPSPYYRGYSFRKIIQVARGPYVSFLKALLTNTTPQGVIGSFLYSTAESAFIDGALGRISTAYGQTIDLEVKAKMPNIYKKTNRKAATMLRARNLVPQPDHSRPIYTQYKSLDGRVASHRFSVDDRLKAGTGVPYKFFRYRAQSNPVVPTQRTSRCSRLGPADTECNSGFDESYDPTTKCVKCPNKNVWILVPR